MGHASCGACSDRCCSAGARTRVGEVEVPVEVVGHAGLPRRRLRGGAGVAVPVEVLRLHPEPPGPPAGAWPLNILETSPAEFAASFAAAARADAWERLQRESAAKSVAGAPQAQRVQTEQTELGHRPAAAAVEFGCAGVADGRREPAVEDQEHFVTSSLIRQQLDLVDDGAPPVLPALTLDRRYNKRR